MPIPLSVFFFLQGRRLREAQTKLRQSRRPMSRSRPSLRERRCCQPRVRSFRRAAPAEKPRGRMLPPARCLLPARRWSPSFRSEWTPALSPQRPLSARERARRYRCPAMTAPLPRRRKARDHICAYRQDTLQSRDICLPRNCCRWLLPKYLPERWRSTLRSPKAYR